MKGEEHMLQGKIVFGLLASVALLGASDGNHALAADPMPAVVAGSARTDGLGDPLPPGALQRLGTLRLTQRDIQSARFSPDGRTVITAGSCGSPDVEHAMCLWDVGTGKFIRAIPVPESVGDFVLAPDGCTLASPGGGRSIRLFDLRSGKLLLRIDHPKELALENWIAVAFMPDGKQLVSVGADSPIQFWDSHTGKLLRELKTAKGAAAVAVTPDGKAVVTLDRTDGLDHDIVMRDSATGKELWRCSKAVDSCLEIALSPDGKILAASSGEGTVRLFETSKGQSLRRLDGHRGEVHAVAFAPDGRRLASAGQDGTVRLWDVASGKELHSLRGHAGQVLGVAFAPDSATLVSFGGDDSARLWDVGTGKEKVPLPGHRGDIDALAVSPEGKTVVTSSIRDHTLRFWDLASGEEKRRLARPKDSFSPLTYLSDSRLLIGASGEGILHVLELATGRREDVGLVSGRIRALAVSPDGSALATASPTDLALWQGPAWRRALIVRHPEEGGLPTCLAFSPDGKTLATDVASRPVGAVRLLDFGTGRELHRLVRSEQVDDIKALAFSPDGNNLAVGYAYGGRELSLWDPATGREKWRLAEPVRSIDFLTFSPDGRYLVTAARGDVIRIWEVATGKSVGRFDPGQDDVSKVTYTPDGRRLLSQGQFTVLVWDVTAIAGAVRAKRLGRQDLKGLWEALAGDDIAKAYSAVWQLASVPEDAVTFLSARLEPVSPVAAKEIARWIRQLDDDEFSVRQRATEELVRHADAALPALREALRKNPPAEAERRLEKIIESAEASFLAGERLRELRAVAILEYAATPEAKKCLEVLATGAVGARLTREVKASLERLGRRPGKS